MADFKSHITGSTLVGVGYGYWGVAAQSMSIESGILAGGLCAVSGMLPDLDSDSGRAASRNQHVRRGGRAHADD